MISRMPTSMPAPLLRNVVQPKNSLFRAAAVMLKAHLNKADPEKTAKQLYGKDHGLEPLITRSTSAPATMTDTTWAGPLVHDLIRSELIQKITALSAAAGLMKLGLKVDFTGTKSITIPGRTLTPAAAGDWIEEGAAIPVRHPTIAPDPNLKRGSWQCFRYLLAKWLKPTTSKNSQRPLSKKHPPRCSTKRCSAPTRLAPLPRPVF